VTEDEANAILVTQHWSVAGGQKLADKIAKAETQALMAFGPDGRKEDLLGRISAEGSVNWTAPEGQWTVYAVSQRPGPQKVKRAAPGGEGWMLNLAYPRAMTNYLGWMDQAFATYTGAKPRAQYHDSYEYKMDWSPVLLTEFEKRRGYRLQDELDAFLTGKPADRAARVKGDYRETISDIMVEETIRQWVQWSHSRGFLTRNEAHGSPGNWLDLYAEADIPETEMFRADRNRLISKFASSAAHVSGKPLVSAETGTWLAEHFTETLADMKYLLDDLFLTGVNHIFYHGTCYSPETVPWPGWVFYASYEMNPRNALWHDVAALNAYATRCQSVLQAGWPDNDLLLYWPIHDLWNHPAGMTRNLTVHARDWFEEQPIGKTAQELWQAGYPFDYVSDRQLASATVSDHRVSVRGSEEGGYRAVVVPECAVISSTAMRDLLRLAQAGGTVIFVRALPHDVAGWGRLDHRRLDFQVMKATAESIAGERVECAGRVLVGPLSSTLPTAGAHRERMFDMPGLMCLRRRLTDGRYYFIANRGAQTVDGWVPLASRARSVAIMDPLTDRIGLASIRQGADNQIEARLSLPPGASMILRTFDSHDVAGQAFSLWEPAGDGVELRGRWQVEFLSGGPELPGSFATDQLASWTESGDTNAQRFAGTARYTLKFDAPGDCLQAGLEAFQLDLGKVCQSARVRMNGQDLGTLFTPPFRVTVNHLQPADNVLEVEVTNTSANRIRDLDRRGVSWQTFHDINFVNMNYKEFDASNWPLEDSGLLGPVRLIPVRSVNPAAKTR
jgi:hypothetical protein